MIKLKIMENYSQELLDGDKSYSFLNFASIGSLFKDPRQDPISYFCDGMLLSFFMSKVTGRKVERVSFDFTSIADQVFGRAEQQHKRLYFVGANQAELDKFLDKIRARYPALIVAGAHNGYFDEQEAQQIHADIRENADILVVSLGAGRQESFIRRAKEGGFSGVAFTCGGFIRQESMSQQVYYPPLINKLKLRAFYRMYKEPHTIRRYLFEYPRNFMHLLAMIASRKVDINIMPQH